MKLQLVLLFLCFISVSLLLPLKDYEPKANPKAVVIFGHARFTVLTPTLVRMELSKDGKVFDDRQTIQIVNRNLPVPEFSVTNPNPTTIVISTGKLTLTHVSTYNHSGVCQNPRSDTDQSGGQRVPQYPNGITVKSQDDCCNICEKDSLCTAWVYAPNTPASVNCWLMMNVQSTVHANGRIFGGNTGSNGFTPQNLNVALDINGKKVIWTPGTQNTGNLKGTNTALDCYSTKEICYRQYEAGIGEGLLSQDGWYVLDDTSTARYDGVVQQILENEIPWYDQNLVDLQDLYFLGDGLSYRDTLKNYASVGGAIGLPPRTAFGVWWSRYYAYSQQQFISEVLTGYATNGLPLSHVVLDMDWHIEVNSPGCDTWGGYTFNTNLFPNPQNFISWLHGYDNVLKHPVKLLLNVHPQTGVDHCQANYPQFARAMGVDPSTQKTIPCNFGNTSFASNLFSIFLDAEPLTGVDYWWTDYGGCGGPSDRSLFWSNYYYDSHLQLYRHRRPLVLSRNGGLGNHRYPIGFSGDTFQAFLTLQYEIQMTPMAANVLFGYWSHDIGGFHTGNGSPGDGNPKNKTGSELLLRWLQFGSVAPIFRTHCDHCERRIWLFPHFFWMKHAMLLRNALVPYIYTWSQNAWESGVSLIYPVYYDAPLDSSAYSYNQQYMFGPHILASPIYQVTNEVTGLVSQSVWLPSGTWSNWNGTKTYTGPIVVTEQYGVGDIPLFVKPQFAIPMQTTDSVVSSFADPLIWTVFESPSGSGRIYEDDGESMDYVRSVSTSTTINFTWSNREFSATIATQGTYPGMPRSRAHGVQLRGFPGRYGNPRSVVANGKVIPPGTGSIGWYVSTVYGLDVTQGALVVNVGEFTVSEAVQLRVQF
eukprot:TRINITY_DN4546_c0_g1_i15.p1 TRINITY_DN4546_c0_g1~~TRINITY_DN4546_c0_g1_i15.p1  ORF type:complete len:870 (-),score=176.31 TRINITY_DN4546_c0_g1_i15:56-2665(-)